MNTFVSVITPCYNNKKTIHETILSVINQTYTQWEMLIIDDCSIDGSDIIIKQYCEQDPRIKYLKTEKPSGSPSIPRNLGLENAKGEFVCFLDSDDYWLPNKLEEQIEFIQKNKYSFVYSNYEKISYDGKRNNRIIKTKSQSNYTDNLKSCEIPCLTACISKRIISNTRFLPIKKEDYAFWLEILRKGITAYNTNKIHALYRESKNSRSSNKIKMIKGQWYILRQIEKINIFRSFFFLIIYLWKGYKKYIK